MKNKFFKSTIITFVIILIFSIFTIIGSALDFIGSGGSSATPPSTTNTSNGYMLISVNHIVAYRFTVYNGQGERVGTIREAYLTLKHPENNPSGYYDSCLDGVYTTWISGTTTHNKTIYNYATKYGKYELINAYKNGVSFSTVPLTNGTIEMADSTFKFATALPTTTSNLGANMDTWISEAGNLNKILYYCIDSSTNISNFETKYPGGKIIVEPMFFIRLGEYYHALTVTEAAVYGAAMFGKDNGTTTSSTPDSWGYIANYTNMNYPNALYTTNGKGMWSNASKLSAPTNFDTIIKGGYGVGIMYGGNMDAYGNWNNKLKIYYHANGASGDPNNANYYVGSDGYMYKKSDNTRYFQTIYPTSLKNLINRSTFGITKSGHKYGHWGTQTNGGTIFNQDTDYPATTFNPAILNGDCEMTVYAQWTPSAAAYKVNHYQQNITDNNYTLVGTNSYTGTIGASVTPPVNSYTGFASPAAQTVTVASDGSTTVNYYYNRYTYYLDVNGLLDGSAVGNTSGNSGSSNTTTKKPATTAPTTKKQEITTEKQETTTKKPTTTIDVNIVGSYGVNYCVYCSTCLIDIKPNNTMTCPSCANSVKQGSYLGEYCEYCGKNKKGKITDDGEWIPPCKLGGCSQFSMDTKCSTCNIIVPAHTCHTCK